MEDRILKEAKKINAIASTKLNKAARQRKSQIQNAETEDSMRQRVLSRKQGSRVQASVEGVKKSVRSKLR